MLRQWSAILILFYNVTLIVSHFSCHPSSVIRQPFFLPSIQKACGLLAVSLLPMWWGAGVVRGHFSRWAM
jgi:hypothetical protein